MKNKTHIIRLIIIIGIGIFLTYKVYQFRFSCFVFDYIFFLGIAIIGFIFWLWTIYKDYKQYRATDKRKYLIGIFLGLTFLTTIFGIIWKNESDLNKPTLVRVCYDGDFNGTGIDFKTDGTYIFDNSAIGLSDYTYGTYKIKGQKITLDKNEIENIIKTNLLEIKDIKENGVDYLAGEYLFQIGPNGSEIKRATKFRVVEDNRTQ